MTVHETFWAATFGAACGTAGVMALLGILTWAWKKIVLWRIEREICRKVGTYRGVLELAGLQPPPTGLSSYTEAPVPTGRPQDAPPPQVAGSYDGPPRPVGTVVGSYPGVIGSESLPSGEVVFRVRVTDSPSDTCPCCRRPMKPLTDLVGPLQKYIEKAFPPPMVAPCEGPPAQEPPPGPPGPPGAS